VTLVELLEEFLQAFFREAVRYEEKVHAVHAIPVFVEDAMIPDARVQGSSGEGCEFGNVEVVDGEAVYVAHTAVDGFLGLSGESDHDEPLCPHACPFDVDNGFAQLGKVTMASMLCQQVRVSGFNAKADHPAARLFEGAEQRIVDTIRACCTVECEVEGVFIEKLAQLDHAVAVQGELVVVNIEVSDAKPVAHILHMSINVICRIVAECCAEHGAVAIAAGVGAAPAGDKAGVGRFGVIEYGEGVQARVTGKFLVGGEWQCVEIDALSPSACAFNRFALAIEQALAIIRIASHEGEQGLLAFTPDPIIESGGIRHCFFSQGGYVGAPDNGYGLWRPNLDLGGSFGSIAEGRGCATESDIPRAFLPDIVFQV